MNDRFRFRTWYRDYDGEYEMIYDTQATYDNGNNKPPGSYNHCDFLEVLEDERCITMQCTGLKDKNGKLIYEGDIAEMNICATKWIGFVEWDIDASFAVNRNGLKWGLSDAAQFEIIGNIYENPELLEA